MSLEILRQTCSAWSAIMARLSLSSRNLRESRCQAELSEFPTLARTSMPEVLGKAKVSVVRCTSMLPQIRGLDLKRIYKQHENEKKRLYTQRMMDVEQGTFTPLVFTTTEAWEKSARDIITAWQS